VREFGLRKFARAAPAQRLSIGFTCAERTWGAYVGNAALKLNSERGAFFNTKVKPGAAFSCVAFGCFLHDRSGSLHHLPVKRIRRDEFAAVHAL